MRKYGEIELKLLNLQIGCVLRLARLKRGISQHTLSLSLGTNPTMVGRVERAENISGWDKVLTISQQLDVNFCNLFILKNKEDFLSVVEESLGLENKLTPEKAGYYSSLKKEITKQYNLMK